MQPEHPRSVVAKDQQWPQSTQSTQILQWKCKLWPSETTQIHFCELKEKSFVPFWSILYYINLHNASCLKIQKQWSFHVLNSAGYQVGAKVPMAKTAAARRLSTQSPGEIWQQKTAHSMKFYRNEVNQLINVNISHHLATNLQSSSIHSVTFNLHQSLMSQTQRPD